MKLLNGNLHDLNEDKNEKNFDCNPQILLLQKNNDVVLQVNMTIYKNLERINDEKNDNENSSSHKVKPLRKREIRNMSLISDNLPRDKWIHCAVEAKETFVTTEIECNVNNYKEMKGRNKIKKSEETTMNLFLNGCFIRGESAMGGRTPVYQNVIIGCIPSNLHNDRSSNIRNEREVTDTNIGNDSRNDRDSCANDHSTGPLISDVYWLPTAPLVSDSAAPTPTPIVDPSLWGQSKGWNRGVWEQRKGYDSENHDDRDDCAAVGVNEAMVQPPSTSQLSLTAMLDTGVIILETSIRLLFLSYYDIDVKDGDDVISTSESSSKFSKFPVNVEQICLLSLTLIASGDESVQENTVRIIKKFMTEYESLMVLNKCDMDDNVDGKDGNDTHHNDNSNTKNVVNSIILRFLECLVVFVNEYNTPSMSMAGHSMSMQPGIEIRGTDTQDKNMRETNLLNDNILDTHILDSRMRSTTFNSGI